MDKREDGGSAFPLSGADGILTGMSLRDYFAGQALAGLLTDKPRGATGRDGCHLGLCGRRRHARRQKDQPAMSNRYIVHSWPSSYMNWRIYDLRPTDDVNQDNGERWIGHFPFRWMACVAAFVMNAMIQARR